MRLIPIATALALSGPTPGISLPDLHPFGLSQRQLPSSLGCEAVTGAPMDSTGQYICTGVSDPDPLLHDYVIAFVKDVGICNVVGVSSFGLDDERGTGTRNLFKRVSKAMSTRLGAPDEVVDHASTSTAGQESNFRASITSEDRNVYVQWNALDRHFANMQSASAAISGDEELGLAVYEVYRFSGNDDCLHQMEVITGLTPDD